MFVILGLGSNKSFASLDSLQLLKRACDLLEPLFSDFCVSSVYRTKPMYVTDQADFYREEGFDPETLRQFSEIVDA